MQSRTTPPWVILLGILALSAPLMIAGSLTSARLLPGLPVSALMFVATALVASWVAYRADGRAGLKRLALATVDAGRIRPWAWYAISLVVFPVVIIAQSLLVSAAGAAAGVDIAWRTVPVLFVLLLVAATGEEVAWSAALLIGLFVAFWHVVPFFQAHSSASWVLGQCAFTVGFRVVVTWVYVGGRRSVLAASICHAAYNTAWQLMPDPVWGYNPWVVAGLTWVVVGVLVAVFGARTLSGPHPTSTSSGRPTLH